MIDYSILIIQTRVTEVLRWFQNMVIALLNSNSIVLSVHARFYLLTVGPFLLNESIFGIQVNTLQNDWFGIWSAKL